VSAANRSVEEPARERIVRATVVQAASVAFDRERTLDRVAELTADAAADRAQLVLFPEACRVIRKVPTSERHSDRTGLNAP
jgi:hypothetical protein